MNRRTSASPIALRGPTRLAFVAMLSTLMGVGWACKPTFMNSAALTASVSTSPTPSPSASASTGSATGAGSSGSGSGGSSGAGNSTSAPTLTSITPSSGSSGGGTWVTVAGTSFASGATVTLGGAACTNLTVVSALSITCQAPAGYGTVTASITNTDTGTGSLAAAFTYSAGWGILGHVMRAGEWIAGGFNYVGATGEGVFDAGYGKGVFDGAGHILLVNNQRVTKFNATTGAVIGHVGYSFSSYGNCAIGAQTGWCRESNQWQPGDTDGQFRDPTGIVVVGAYFYVADQHRIQRFNLATGAFSKAIGATTGAAGDCVNGPQTANGWCVGGTFQMSAGDGGLQGAYSLATDGTYLYAPDVNHRVQRFNLSTGVFAGAIGYVTAGCGGAGIKSTWCTGGSFSNIGSASAGDGGFNLPVGLSINGTLLYVVDQNNHRVQKFNLSSGTAATFMGAIGNSTVGGGGTPCTAGVQTSFCTGGTFSSSALEGGFNNPMDVVAQGTDVYVTENMSYRLQRFTDAGAYVGSIGKATSGGTCAVGIQSGWCTGGTFTLGVSGGAFNLYPSFVPDPSGTLLAVMGGGQLQKFTRATGAYLASWGGTYQTSAGANLIQTSWSAPTSPLVPGYGSTVDGGFWYLSAVAIHPSSTFLYTAEQSRIQRFNLATGAFAGAVGKSTLTGTCIAGAQTSWCTSGSFSTGLLMGQISTAQGIAIDPTGTYLLVADSAQRVQRFLASSGAISSVVGRSSATSGTCVTGAQTGWCDGGTWNISGLLDGQFTNPRGLAFDGAGFFYVGDSGHVQKFNLSTGAHVGTIGYSSTAAGTCVVGKQNGWCQGGNYNMGVTNVDGVFNNTTALAISGGALYVLESANHRVQRFNLATGAFEAALGNRSGGSGGAWGTGGTYSAGTSDGQLNGPQGMAIASGHLYVRDQGRVQKFNLSTGAFVGAVGYSAAAGSGGAPCAGGTQTTFCTGGSFQTSSALGGIGAGTHLAVDPASSSLFIPESVANGVMGNRLQRLSPY